jgi:hypothetical protein
MALAVVPSRSATDKNNYLVFYGVGHEQSGSGVLIPPRPHPPKLMIYVNLELPYSEIRRWLRLWAA